MDAQQDAFFSVSLSLSPHSCVFDMCDVVCVFPEKATKADHLKP